MTTAINFKTIFFGLMASVLVLFFATGVATRPLSKPVTLTKTDNVQFIYRGVPIGHPGYNFALEGIVKPIGGSNTPWMHRDGHTNSNFSSWTTNLSVAYRYATQGMSGPCDGIILVKKVKMDSDRLVDISKEPGGDVYAEKEILIKGMVNGAIPILVTRGIASNDLVNLIKQAL